MDYKNFYNFMLKLTNAFEKSSCRKDFLDSLEAAFSKVLQVESIKIYVLDEFSYVLKDFEKPWESSIEQTQNAKIQEVINSFIGSKDYTKLEDNIIYMNLD